MTRLRAATDLCLRSISAYIRRDTESIMICGKHSLQAKKFQPAGRAYHIPQRWSKRFRTTSATPDLAPVGPFGVGKLRQLDAPSLVPFAVGQRALTPGETQDLAEAGYPARDPFVAGQFTPR